MGDKDVRWLTSTFVCLIFMVKDFFSSRITKTNKNLAVLSTYYCTPKQNNRLFSKNSKYSILGYQSTISSKFRIQRLTKFTDNGFMVNLKITLFLFFQHCCVWYIVHFMAFCFMVDKYSKIFIICYSVFLRIRFLWSLINCN
jgi:hypothetical protein